MKKTPHHAINPRVAKLFRRAAGLCLAATACIVTPSLPANPSAPVYWDPNGSHSTDAGGSGTWNSADLSWWNGSSSEAWLPGTDAGSSTDRYIDIVFGATGQTAPHTVTIDLTDVRWPPTASATTYSSTLSFKGDYIVQSGQANGTTFGGAVNSAYTYFVVNGVADSTVTFGGNGNPITLYTYGNNSGTPSLMFRGSGTFIMEAGARLWQAQVNGRITIGAINENATTVFMKLGSSATGSRLVVDNGMVNVDGADVRLVNTLNTANRSTIWIGNAGAASALNTPSVINLNRGTITAEPTNAAGARGNNGILFGAANVNYSGGTFNLNGGLLTTTDIFARPDASAATTALFVFNGGTLNVSGKANQAQLNEFISGFQNTAMNAVLIKEGGAFIDTSDIAAATNGVAAITSGISGTGGLTKLGAKTLELGAVNTFTGPTNVMAGELKITVANGLAASGAVNVESGARLNLNGQSSLLRNLSGGGTIDIGAGDLTVFVDGAGASVFSGAITGEGALTKSGTGALTLTGPKSFTGGITVSEGRLQGNTSSLAGDIVNDGVLSFAQETEGVYAGAISGSGLLEKTGAGRLTLTQAQTYTGGISILAGALQGDAASLRGDIANDGIVIFEQQTNAVYAGALSGTGAFEKTGAGVLTLDQASAHTGYAKITQGALKAGAADVIGASSDVTVAAGASFDFDNHNQTLRNLSGAGYLATGGGTLTVFTGSGARTVFGGTLAGTGGFIKTGAGTQILSGINNLTGTTLVNEGALLVSSAMPQLGGDITVAAGAVFGGQGTVGANGKTFSMGAGSVLQIGLNPLDGPATLTIDSAVTLNSATLSLDLFAGGTSDRLLIGGGSFSADGVNTIDLGLFSTGTFNLGNIGALHEAGITIGGRAVTDPSSRQTGSLGMQGSDLILITDAGPSRIMYWTGAAGANWDENWEANGASSIIFAAGDTVRFDSESDAGHEANRNINISAVTASVSDIIVSGSGNYTIGGGAIIADRTGVVAGSTEVSAATAGGKLVKQGTGRLTLANSGVNDFKGGVDLEGGGLVLASAGALGASNLNVTGSGARVEIGVTGIDITGEVDTGKFGLLMDTLLDDATISGAISGSGGVTKKGAGSLTLGGANTFSGTLAVDEGVVFAGDLASLGAASGGVSIASGATLSLIPATRGDLSFDHALSGPGVLMVRLADAADNFAFAAGAGTVFAGTVQLNQGTLVLDSAAAAALANATLALGADGIARKADGDLSLNALTFNGGMLQLATGATPGPAGLLTVGMLDTGSTVSRVALDTTRFTEDQVNPAVPPEPGIFDQGTQTEIRLVAANDVRGTGAFVLVNQADGAALPNPTHINLKQDGETVADATYGHTITVQAEGDQKGLYLGHGITAIDVLAGKTLLLDNAGAGQSTLAATLSGEGSIDVRASGEGITLAVENTLTGTTLIGKGTLRAGVANALGNSTAIVIAEGAVFDLRSFNQTARNLAGAGGITLGGATLTVNNTEDTEFAGSIQGSGRLVKTGSNGTLTLSGDNQHTGGTTISAGRLRATSPRALGSGAVSVASAATLEFSGAGQAILTAAVTGGGRIEVIDGTVIFSATNNAFSSLKLSGRSQVTAAGAANSIGGAASAINVGAGSTLVVAAKGAPVRAGSLTLDGGRVLFAPGAALAVQNEITTTSGGAIIFGGSGVSQLSYGGLAGGLVYDVPSGMSLSITEAGGNALTYTVVNQAASPLKDIAMTFTSLLATMDAVTGRVNDHFLVPVGKPPARRGKWNRTAWLKTVHSNSDYEATERRIGHTARVTGYIAGIDAMRWERFLAGAYAGVASSRLRTTNNTRVEADQQFAGLYSALRLGSFYLGGDLTGGRFTSDSYRNEMVGQATGSYDTACYGGNLELGFLIGRDTGATFKPSVGVRYMNVSMKNYKERGTGAMNIADFTDELVQSNVGLQASRSFKMPWGLPAVVDVSAGWRQIIHGPRDHVNATFVADPDKSIVLLGDDDGKGGVVASIALRMAVGRKAMLGMGYENETSPDKMRHVFNASLGFWW
jgi:autotransporter-associated beta strand protein